MSRSMRKQSLYQLTLENIKELEKDRKLLEQIEKKIENKYINEANNAKR
ncbi:hypothetical protein QFZ28_005879 [Neobacillus niacini]|nr:hypothetical protein [Neobacillus niacini]